MANFSKKVFSLLLKSSISVGDLEVSNFESHSHTDNKCDVDVRKTTAFVVILTTWPGILLYSPMIRMLMEHCKTSKGF